MAKTASAQSWLRRLLSLPARWAGLRPVKESAAEAHAAGLRARLTDLQLFDEDWYISRYPESLNSACQPIDFFLRHGFPALHAPGPAFDPHWYMGQYPDVKAAWQQYGHSPLLHYMDYGAAEGRLPAAPDGLLTTARDLYASVAPLDPILSAWENPLYIEHLEVVESRSRSWAYARLKALMGRTQFPYDQIICLSSASLLRDQTATISQLASKGRTLCLFCDAESGLSISPLNATTDVDTLALPDDPMDLRVETLWLYIQALRPARLINLGSPVCWILFRRNAIALGHLCQSFAVVTDERFYGDLRDCLTSMTGIYTTPAQQTHFFERFGLPSSFEAKFRRLSIEDVSPLSNAGLAE